MKHDTSLPAQPRPFLRVFVVLLCSIFLHIYLIYFPVEIQTVLAPVLFFSHIKIQKKSHYKDTQPL